MNSVAKYEIPQANTELTLEGIVRSNPPSMKQYAVHSVGAFEVQRQICLLIIQLQKQVHVNKGFDAETAKMAASLIYSEFGYLSFEDLILAFKRGLTGQYGQLYDRLDIAVVSNWLNAYTAFKRERSEQISNSFKAKEVKKIPEAPLTDEQKARIAELKKGIYEKINKATDKFTAKEQKKFERKPLPQEEHDHMIYEIFDGLHKEQDYPMNSAKQRVVSYQGKEMTQEEFLKQSYE
jgi:hypothetical protein